MERCENCQGEGEEVVEMQFMADLHLKCEVCAGRRFKDEVLEVEYKHKSIFDILELTVDEAVEFFENQKSILSKLHPLQEVGREASTQALLLLLGQATVSEVGLA